MPEGQIREQRVKYLTDERRIKAVTVCFTDLEGRLHMLDYDKKFLLKSLDNLTFDGSSVRGFSQQHESDLRLRVDWPAFYWLPSDVFGPGKVIAFAEVCARDGTPYAADMRQRLKHYTEEFYKKTAPSARLPTKSKASCSAVAMPSGAITKSGASTFRPAATTTRCPATICVASSIARRKRSGPWASPTKKIIPRSRPRSSR